MQCKAEPFSKGQKVYRKGEICTVVKVATVPLPADDRHKVPGEDSVLECGLCGIPRQVRARKSDKNMVGPFFVGGCRVCYENSENLKWGQGGGTRIQFQEDPREWRWD